MTVHEMTAKEQKGSQHIESYMVIVPEDKNNNLLAHGKTIAYYKPFLGRTQYFVCALRKGGKNQDDYFEPVFRTDKLDSAIFAWHNVFVFDRKNWVKKFVNKDQIPLTDFDKKIKAEAQNWHGKKVRDKDLKVTIAKIESEEEWFGGNTPNKYTPMGNRKECLDRDTITLMEIYC